MRWPSTARPGRARPGPGRADILLAAVAFAVLCIAALTAATQLVEPDDDAYQASIVAITQGRPLTLSTAQAHALSADLRNTTGRGEPARLARRLAPPAPLQWVQLASGRWISEKDPGYPFLAAPFQALGVIRLAPLFYGALGCLGLSAGARRWLGRTVAWWLGAATACVAGMALFNTLVYGGPLTPGYRPGEIRFSLGAAGPNARSMPGHLIEAMPMLLPGLAALAWIAARWLRRAGGGAAATARRDLAVALALAAPWFAVGGLYATYTWTTLPGLTTLQSVRCYADALGPMTLLGAWLLIRLARPAQVSSAGGSTSWYSRAAASSPPGLRSYTLIPACGGRSCRPQRTKLYSTAQRTPSSVSTQDWRPMPPPALNIRVKNGRSSPRPRCVWWKPSGSWKYPSGANVPTMASVSPAASAAS